MAREEGSGDINDVLSNILPSSGTVKIIKSDVRTYFYWLLFASLYECVDTDEDPNITTNEWKLKSDGETKKKIDVITNNFRSISRFVAFLLDVMFDEQWSGTSSPILYINQKDKIIQAYKKLAKITEHRDILAAKYFLSGGSIPNAPNQID